MTQTRSVPVSLMRGGTSKGVFVGLDLLAGPPEERDALVRALLGSPDPMQLDGLGGTKSSTSKLVGVARAADARALGHDVPHDAELAYWFAQVGVADGRVDWSANCGNLTSAVLPYALVQGLVEGTGDTRASRLFNLNTRGRIDVDLALVDGLPAVDGEFVMAGFPAPGSRIDVTYLEPAGNVTGSLFPTGRRLDSLAHPGGLVKATILDVTSPVVVVRAADLDVDLGRSADDLNGDVPLLERLAGVRAAAGRLLGVKDSPTVPRLMLLAPPVDGAADVEARMISMGQVHHAFPGTGLAAAGVVATVGGTVADGVSTASGGVLRLRHAKGVVEVVADLTDDGTDVKVAGVSVPRSARELMRGEFFVRAASL